MKDTRYDIIFCTCGKIHAINYEHFDWMIEDSENRSLINVDTNCGITIEYFLNEHIEDDGTKGYDLCSKAITDETKIIDGVTTRVILSKGFRIPLMSGGYADCLMGNKFVNSSYIENELHTTWLPDAEKKDPNCTQIDFKKLIKEIDNKDILKSMTGYIPFMDMVKFL